MKQIIATYFVTAAMLFGGCTQSKEALVTPDAQRVEIAIGADINEPTTDSRAIIDDGYENGHFTGTWEPTDRIHVLVVRDGMPEYATMQYDDGSGLFKGEVSGGRGSRTYRAIYPYGNEWGNIPFGRERSQNGNSFNSSCDAMLSAEISATNAEAGMDDSGAPLVFGMKHLTAIVAAHFSASGNVENEKVRAIIVSSDTTPLSADMLKIDSASATAVLGDDGQSHHIIVFYDDTTAPTAADARAFFNIAAGDCGKLTFSVVTTGHVSDTIIDRTGKPLVSGHLYYLNRSLSEWSETSAPTAVWRGNADFEPVEITDDMTGKCSLEIAVPAGLHKMRVLIDSPFLTKEEMEGIGLSTDMDIVDNAQYAETLAGLGLTTGDTLVGSRTVDFNIETLVPLIKIVAGERAGENKFTIEVTDLAGNTTTATMTFFTRSNAEPTIVCNNDTDLWANSVSFTVTNAADAVVEYRMAGTDSWHTAAADATKSGVFRIEPQFEQVAAEGETLAYRKAVEGTGIWLGHSYEVRLTVGGKVVKTLSFDAGGTADTIPNAGMESWSNYSVTGMFVAGTISYPNADNSESTADKRFWVSGNNNTTKTLCSKDTATTGFNGTACAKLQGKKAFGVFAAGNLFAGVMEFDSETLGKGYARFGHKYDYTARPSAMRIHINGTPGSGDYSRIYFCIVDWSERHTVISGLNSDESTFWSPLKQNSVAEGAILGYGLLDITASTNGWTTVTLPVHWYDTATKPATGNYSIVISAAASAEGDYMKGSTDSVLCIEDFEWVY